MPVTGNILWLTNRWGISAGYKFVLDAILKKEGLSLSQIFFCCVREKYTKSGELKKEEIMDAIDDLIVKIKPKMIVCNDEETLSAFTAGSLFFCRGSVYEYKGLSVLIVAETAQWINTSVLVKGKHRAVPGRWILINDIQKLGRWMKDKQRQQPIFTYSVCRTIHDLMEAKEFLLDCILIAEDIETHPDKITVVGFTGWHKSGRVHSYVIPFYNPFKYKNCHWNTESEELYAWEVIRIINKSDVLKVFQNGGYDIKFFIRYRIAVCNYILDVMHLFHSIFTEAPKRLNFISSILLDFCRFWKDEAKGEDEAGAEHKGKFKDIQAYERYLRYNALDCYNTLLCCNILVYLISKLPWAMENYKTEFLCQIGPANAGSMRGMRVNVQRQKAKRILLEEKSKLRLAELKVIADDPEFNPGSPKQFGHFLYNTLGAKKPELHGKNAKLAENTVSEIVLKVIRNDPSQMLQPIFDYVIDKVLDYKKPQNNISKYGNLILSSHGRWMYELSAAGTETGRWASRKSIHRIGNQVQNVPLKIRDIVVADPGYVFFEPDFSQSDLWFVAYSSGDQNLIANLLSGKDMHCVHGAFFFKIPYEDFYSRYKSGDPFIADEPTGLRYITKRIVHGKNYNMAGFTLYLLMGRAAVIAAAKALGHKDPESWSAKQLASFCQSLLNLYDKMYPRLAKYQEELMAQGAKDGNRITAANGRTRLFFGDLLKDKNTQREAIAYVGQGGTAGNINRGVLKIYYKSPELNSAILITQTHDSLLFQLPEENFHELANKILTIMAEPITINGMTFSVPTAAKVGYSWGPGPLDKEYPLVMKYSKDMTLDTLQRNEQKVFEYYQKIIVDAQDKEFVSRGNENEDNEEQSFFNDELVQGVM